jgi:murein DD-endopeptidase MepM/ murein hydrolase activator NlpD
MNVLAAFLAIGLASVPLHSFGAPVFKLPTPNNAVLNAAGGETAFAGTTGRPWMSGTFGCVRTDGRQLHEGIDIRCTQRDRSGEPTDPVTAAADGTIAYVSSIPGLSNYGKYIVVRHTIERMEIYTLYAHLAAITPGLKAGDAVRQGDRIGTLGRTSNTREGISKDRAHCHFEIDLVVNDRYAAWHTATLKGVRNDHGNFNGHNLLGIDPWKVFLEQNRLGTNFSLVQYLRSQPEMCRVQVRSTDFPWLRRYRALVEKNPAAEREGIAGYELALSFNGLPLKMIPRTASELKFTGRTKLLSVNETEWQAKPCGKLVFKRGQLWTLTAHGEQVLSLLLY